MAPIADSGTAKIVQDSEGPGPSWNDWRLQLKYGPVVRIPNTTIKGNAIETAGFVAPQFSIGVCAIPMTEK